MNKQSAIKCRLMKANARRIGADMEPLIDLYFEFTPDAGDDYNLSLGVIIGWGRDNDLITPTEAYRLRHEDPAGS